MQPLLLLLLSILPSQLAAEQTKDPNNENEAALRASAAATAKEFAGRCEFSVGAVGSARLVLHPEPILRWSNPTVGQVFGEVFVWTDNGRPAVIGSWYRWFSPYSSRTFEVCSLTGGRASGRINEIEFWNTAKSGLTLKWLAEADAPAKTPATRLVQMRRMAGNFAAHLADTRGNDAGVKRQLRLLPQPVFRYLAPKAGSTYLDGALFAFVEGTDPEVFLVLEATDEVTWEYGLVRMNGDALRITFREKEVWTAPKIDNLLNQIKEPYTQITTEQVLKEPVAIDKKTPPATKAKP